MHAHFIHDLLHWLSVHTGTSIKPSPSVYYNFWSGFGSDIGEVVIIGGMVHFARNHNCGVKGCWRFHRYEYDMDGVIHKVCRHHHPKLGKDHLLTHLHLLEHHEQRRREAEAVPGTQA
jgi:hypothetical protein